MLLFKKMSTNLLRVPDFKSSFGQGAVVVNLYTDADDAVTPFLYRDNVARVRRTVMGGPIQFVMPPPHYIEIGNCLWVMEDDGGVQIALVPGVSDLQTRINGVNGAHILPAFVTAQKRVTFIYSHSDNYTVISVRTHLPFSDITLGSAGGVSLVNDGVGPTLLTKGLIAGTALSFVDSGTDITLNAATTASTIFQESLGVISPILGTASLLIGDTATNFINSSNGFVIGGNTNVVNKTAGFNFLRNGIIGGNSNSVLNTGTFVDDNIIFGGIGNTIASPGNPTNSHILGGNDNTLVRATASCIINGEDNSMTHGSQQFMLGGEGNIIEDTVTGQTVKRNSIIGGLTNTIDAAGGFQNDCIIIGGELNTIVASAISVRNMVMNGNNCHITGTVGGATLIGNEITCTHSNNMMISTSTAGIDLTSVVAEGFDVKAQGGFRFFSNNGLATGVSLANGASSWAAISDINKKENLVVCDGGYCLDSIDQMPIYEYNYINNPPEQVCMGPVAQDWNTYFGAADATFDVLNSNGDVVLDEGTGLPVTEVRPAKDPLKIEMMDMIGVLLAAVKELNVQIKTLQTRVTVLEAFHV